MGDLEHSPNSEGQPVFGERSGESERLKSSTRFDTRKRTSVYCRTEPNLYCNYTFQLVIWHGELNSVRCAKSIGNSVIKNGVRVKGVLHDLTPWKGSFVQFFCSLNNRKIVIAFAFRLIWNDTHTYIFISNLVTIHFSVWIDIKRNLLTEQWEGYNYNTNLV